MIRIRLTSMLFNYGISFAYYISYVRRWLYLGHMVVIVSICIFDIYRVYPNSSKGKCKSAGSSFPRTLRAANPFWDIYFLGNAEMGVCARTHTRKTINNNQEQQVNNNLRLSDADRQNLPL